MGSRELGGVKRILLGSISESIIHHSRRPVLVMRGGQDAWPPSRVIIGDDSSEDAREAGELAARIDKLFGTTVLDLGQGEFSPRLAARTHIPPPTTVTSSPSQDRPATMDNEVSGQ